MKNTLNNLLAGYRKFRKKYDEERTSLMLDLHHKGQNPNVLIVSCCDSRVDPALLFQCDPGDLFVIRNIANIIPPHEQDAGHHGTSAALEYGVKTLKVKHIIILGHSECGGIKKWIDIKKNTEVDESAGFMNSWLSLINIPDYDDHTADECAKLALKSSYENILSFPWVREKIDSGELMVHLWFFDIETSKISAYSFESGDFAELDR